MHTITYKKGNAVSALLNDDVTFLLHCCNCQANMGSGIAKEIAERIPSAKEADDKFHDCHKSHNDSFLGGVSGVDGVVNLYAQEFYGTYGEHYKKTGRQLNYGALSGCLFRLSETLGRRFTKDTIAVPVKMASDRAGGDWEVVKEMIEFYLLPYADIVYYEFNGE